MAKQKIDTISFKKQEMTVLNYNYFISKYDQIMKVLLISTYKRKFNSHTDGYYFNLDDMVNHMYGLCHKTGYPREIVDELADIIKQGRGVKLFTFSTEVKKLGKITLDTKETLEYQMMQNSKTRRIFKKDKRDRIVYGYNTVKG